MSFNIPDDYQLGSASGSQNISSLSSHGAGPSSASSSSALGGSAGMDFTMTPTVTTRMPFGAGASLFQSTSGGGGPGGLGASAGHGRYDDLKLMLESNKDGLKLEAMRRIIAMIAKGRSGDGPRELFAHVVKSVVTQNVELKKLVYLYLTRYAEQEQDLALLSVSSFQRSGKDPNPLIRASALRVLCSIRVPMIAPIMLVAIRESANDMSPYVRKTAAHAISKLYTLEPDMRDEIITIIERLLQDRTSLVLASAVYAFEQVCPDRIDLIHQNYRKFCALMADFDEWGQVILISLLLRYARTQFTDPNRRDDIETSNELEAAKDDEPPTGPVIDADLRLLLRSVRPLLSSRNSSVALSVIQVYLHLAPRSEIGPPLVKPLIRLLHSHREIQLVILANIVSLTSNYTGGDVAVQKESPSDANGHSDSKQENGTEELATTQLAEGGKESADEDDFYKLRHANDSSSETSFIRSMFEPHLKSFFIKSRDSTQVKIFKLQVLTNLANSSNIPLILREFQAYIQNFHDSDVDFVSAVIHAIGACAARIEEVSHICLNGLIGLLSNRNPSIVAHSIVVIRSQIVNHSASVGLIIKQITRLFDSITTPQARATIVWILAEFADKNNRAFNHGPDVLRKIAKIFHKESDLVKLQALNLAAKLYVTAETKYGMSTGTTDAMPSKSADDAEANGTNNGLDTNSTITNPTESGDEPKSDKTPEEKAHKKKVIDGEKLKALVTYIFNLAKYDLNYDVRDRGRFLRALITRPVAVNILLTKAAKQKMSAKLNCSTSKSESTIISLQTGSSSESGAPSKLAVPDGHYRMGTLSHFLGRPLAGYEPLPSFPDEAPDRTVRDKPEPIAPPSGPLGRKSLGETSKKQGKVGFYSDESEEDSETESEEDSDESSEEEEEAEEAGSGSEGTDQEETGESENEESDDEDEDESASEDSGSDSESDEEEKVQQAKNSKAVK